MTKLNNEQMEKKPKQKDRADVAEFIVWETKRTGCSEVAARKLAWRLLGGSDLNQ